MFMKNKIIIGLIPFILLPSFIFGGFAFFYFGDQYIVNNNQNVQIDIENNKEIGSIELRYADENGEYTKNEMLNNSFKNQVFMDYGSVYFIRNDNPTLKRDFIIYYEKPTNINDVANLKISLYCEIIISDTDTRGIEIKEYKDENGESRFYPSSNSVLDIYKPSNIVYKNYNNNFELVNSEEINDTTEKYVACIRDNILADSITNNEWLTMFNINLNYKNYSVINNGERIEGNMAPSVAVFDNSYKNKMISNKNATNYSNIKIKFYLESVEQNNE